MSKTCGLSTVKEFSPARTLWESVLQVLTINDAFMWDLIKGQHRKPYISSKKTSEWRVKFERLWSSVVCSGKTTGFPHVIFWFCGTVLVMLYLVRCLFRECSQRSLTALNEALHAPGPSWGTMTQLCVALLTCVLQNMPWAVHRSVETPRSVLYREADHTQVLPRPLIKGLRNTRGRNGRIYIYFFPQNFSLYCMSLCVQIDYNSLIFGSPAHFAEREASYVWSLKEALPAYLIMEPLRSDGAFAQEPNPLWINKPFLHKQPAKPTLIII